LGVGLGVGVGNRLQILVLVVTGSIIRSPVGVGAGAVPFLLP